MSSSSDIEVPSDIEDAANAARDIVITSIATMQCVSKCCCCCSLKYGNFAYGIICLVLRICALATIFFSTITLRIVIYQSDFGSHYGYGSGIPSPVAGAYIGWLISSSVALFIALKGIIQKRSILLYPYIVVLIFEIICQTIVTIIEATLVSPFLIIKLFLIWGIDIYAVVCLVSLYQRMKQNEKNFPILQEGAQPNFLL